jgi:dihydrofolate reductase
MAKIIVSEFVTLDGVMEAPGGEPGHPHSGWVIPYMGDEQMDFKLAEILEADIHLLGRITYESFAGAWPHREGDFAEKMNAMPKVVVSTTLTSPEWSNTRVIPGDVASEVEKLKSGDGGPILVAGSRTLAQFLLARGLVDELRLMVFPVILGSGKRLFPETEHLTPLELVEVKPFPTGVIVQTYRRAAAMPTIDPACADACADPVKDEAPAAT